MNPKTWTKDNRPFVWTISNDKNAVAKGNGYCIYINGTLYAENLDIESFLKIYNSYK